MQYGSLSNKATYSGFKSFKGKDVADCIEIRGKWYWLQENLGETRELLGKYSVYCLGWGNSYCDWTSFSANEKELLKTTLAK